VPVNIRRRILIAALGSAAVMWPLAVRAEQAAKVPRIGFMVTGSLESPERQATVDAFRQGLREHGYVEGQNITIEYRAADGRIERFPELATELVRLNLDLIVAGNTPAALAAKQADHRYSHCGACHGRPGRGRARAAGWEYHRDDFLGPELAAKRLELLKQALPAVSRVAALCHPGAYGESTMKEMMAKIVAAAGTLQVQLQVVEVRGLPSSIAHSWRWAKSAPMLSSYCRAQCFSASEDISSISPQSTGCPRSQWRESSRNLVASWPTSERA
jgi:ABC transporter substrate binding protein